MHITTTTISVPKHLPLTLKISESTDSEWPGCFIVYAERKVSNGSLYKIINLSNLFSNRFLLYLSFECTRITCLSLIHSPKEKALDFLNFFLHDEDPVATPIRKENVYF